MNFIIIPIYLQNVLIQSLESFFRNHVGKASKLQTQTIMIFILMGLPIYGYLSIAFGYRKSTSSAFRLFQWNALSRQRHRSMTSCQLNKKRAGSSQKRQVGNIILPLPACNIPLSLSVPLRIWFRPTLSWRVSVSASCSHSLGGPYACIMQHVCEHFTTFARSG